MSVLLFFGLPGTGKTTAMVQYVASGARDGHTYFVMDRAAEWGKEDTENPEKENPRWQGYPPKVLEVVNGDSLPEFVPGGVYLFRDPWEGEAVAQLGVDVGNVVFVDDEIDLFARQGGWQNNPLRSFVHRGRHMPNARGEICELHVLGACRRPQSLAADLTQMADQVFIFRVQGQLTLNRLRADAFIEDEEWDAVRNLVNFSYRHHPSGAYLTVKNPFRKTSKTPQKSEEF